MSGRPGRGARGRAGTGRACSGRAARVCLPGTARARRLPAGCVAGHLGGRVRALCALALLALALAGCVPAALPPPRSTPDASEHATAGAAAFARGQALLSAGDGVRAEQYLLLAQREGYPEGRVIAPLVTACAASFRLRAALEHARPFLRRHPRAYRLRALVASIDLALGDSAEAHAELARVVRELPADAHARYLLAVTERDGLSDPEAAAQSFRAYLALAPTAAHAAEARAWLAERAARATSTAGRHARARRQATAPSRPRPRARAAPDLTP